LDEELLELAEDPLQELGYAPGEAAVKQSCVYNCLERDRAFMRQLTHFCVLKGFLSRMENTGLAACNQAQRRGQRCEEVLRQAYLTAASYRVMLRWANQGAAAACWDDPACWCESDEASEVGSECPSGWSCVDGHCLPKCSGDTDCYGDFKCDPSTGRCVQQLGAKSLNGCWTVTFYPAGGGAASVILKFDQDGKLERTWRVEQSRTVETRRFTVAEPFAWQSIRRNMSQNVTLSAGGLVEIRQIVEDNGYAVNAEGVCAVDTSYRTRDEVTIRATVVGDPPSRFESGTYVGQNSTEYPDRPELNSSRTDQGTVAGTSQLACPDPDDDDVLSMEERGDPCRR
jgi:hypothetical protein